MNYGGRKISCNLEKYTKGYSGVVSNIILNQNKKPQAGLTNIPLRNKDKEESFSVYFMGANEERLRNLRKNEQIKKNMKNRSTNNSTSIATRKNWEVYHNQPTQFQSKLVDMNRHLESKSKSSKHKEPKSIGMDCNIISKMILGSGLNVEKKGHSRRRNWGESKPGIIFSKYSSSVEKAQESKGSKKVNENTNEREFTVRDSKKGSPHLEAKTDIKPNLEERPFSSIMNLPNLRLGNIINQIPALSRLSNAPGVNFSYKSPQNKIKGIRPLSHVEKNKSKMWTLPSTGGNGNNSSNNKPCQTQLNNVLSSEQLNTLTGSGDVSTNTNRTKYETQNIETSQNKDLKRKISNIQLKNKTQYPMISNIQRVGIRNRNINKEYSKNITITEGVDYNGNDNTTPQEGVSVDKKYELIAKIQKMDDTKVKKIMKMVEELGTNSEESSEPSISEGRLSANNLVKSGNKNIPLRTNSTLSAKSSLSSFREKKNENEKDNNDQSTNEIHIASHEGIFRDKEEEFSPVVASINKITVNRRSDIKFQRTCEVKESTNTLVLPILNKINSARNDMHNSSHSICCGKIKMVLSSNYGDHQYVGLTGIQFIDDKNNVVNIENALSIGAMPKDVKTYHDNSEDLRIFENVFNNINEVIHDCCMWLTVYKQGQIPIPYLEIVFQQPITLNVIKIWNYNKPGELDKGVRTMEILIEEGIASDDNLIFPPVYHKTVVLRKGIGEENVDYCQNITFPINQNMFTEEELEPFKQIKYAAFLFSQAFETPYLPAGFVFKIILYSTWGDATRIGLNGIEFFDQLGKSIFPNCKPKVLAIPMMDIQEGNDARNVNNLLGDDTNERKIWLVPYINTRKAEKENTDDDIYTLHKANALENTFSNFQISPENSMIKKPNSIYFLFDRPVCLSYIKFLNCTHTPEMGVKDIQIFCDDQIIYAGRLNKSVAYSTEQDKFSQSPGVGSSSSSSRKPKRSAQAESQMKCNCSIVLFTCDSQIIRNIDENALTKGNVRNKYKYQEKMSTNTSAKECTYIMQLEPERLETCDKLM